MGDTLIKIIFKYRIRHYLKKFNELSCFASNVVCTDELKIELFAEGLHPELNRDERIAKAQGVTLF